MTTRRRTTLALCLPLLSGLPAAARNGSDGADWPQWRGPERTGISAEIDWSSEGAGAPLWTKELGLGHSSFAVAEGRVYTLGYDAEAELDSVFCFDLETGAELWRHSYPSEIWDMAHDGGTLTTPTVVGDVVYTSNREGKVFCFARTSGDLLWSRDLRADFELEPPTWGFSASPLVVGEHVVLNVDRVVALDRRSGEDVWASEKSYGNAYSTPAPFTLRGRDYLAVLSGTGLVVLDPAEGAELAFHDWAKEPSIYPMTPVVVDERIFISAGYDRGASMLRFTGDALEELWSGRVMRNKMSGCVLWEGHLYGFDESILKCIDLDGNERWRQRGLGTGSMTVAGGRLLVLDGRGNVIVAEANPKAYVELSRRPVFEDGTAWSTPILSHGRVLCRSSLGRMACLDYRARGEARANAAAALPSAEDVVARHVEALGGREALARVTSVRMKGKSESLINTVRTGEVELVWDATRGFAWNDAAGVHFGYNREFGWTIQPRSKPAALQGPELDDLREAVDLARLFDPARGYASLEVIDARLFEGSECYALRAHTDAGDERMLFFDVATGLYAGYQGEDLPMWTLGAYRDFGGVRLPTQWSTFEPVKGERASATFHEALLEAELEDELFAVPAAVRPFTRTAEEIERDNERLRELHAALLGAWHSEEDAARVVVFEVSEGFLVYVPGEREPSYLTEPGDDGSMTMLGVAYVSFTPERNDDGGVDAITIRVGGEPRDRLVRATQ